MKFKFNHGKETIAESVGVTEEELSSLAFKLSDATMSAIDKDSTYHQSKAIEQLYNNLTKEELAFVASKYINSSIEVIIRETNEQLDNEQLDESMNDLLSMFGGGGEA